MSSGYDFFCKIILRVRPLPANIDAAEPLNSALAGEILLCEHQEKVFCPVRHGNPATGDSLVNPLSKIIQPDWCA